jgi:hypothetical protein
VKYGATVPTGRLEETVKRLNLKPHPAGTTDAYLAETRRDKFE